MDEQRVAISGSERRALPGYRATSAWDPQDRITVTLYLRSDPDAPKAPDPTLEALKPVAERHYVPRSELATYFGASAADLATVSAFAQTHGLEVGRQNAAGASVQLTGTVAAVNDAFGVTLSLFEDKAGQSYRGREGEIHVPVQLADIVEGVFGLDVRPVGRTYLRPAPRDDAPEPVAHAHGQSAVHLKAGQYWPPTVAELYDFPADTDGTGQSLGVLAFNGIPEQHGKVSQGGYDPDMLRTYFTRELGKPMPKLTDVVIQGPGNVPGDGTDEMDSSGEVLLDLCVTGSLAGGAEIIVYFTEFTEQGWVDAIHAAVTDETHNLSVLSISYGNPEYDPGRSAWTTSAVRRVNRAFKIAAAAGMTICVASGDDGSSDEPGTTAVHADFPASSPWVLGCGGTKLEASRGHIASETVWDEMSRQGGATGGGVSRVFKKPQWQDASDVPPAPTRYGGRGVPDVASLADPYTPFMVMNPDGTVGGVGGTSAAAPLWASLVTRLNQAIGSPVGFLNPALYEHMSSGVLRDITVGGNGAYSAKVGWDPCTGLGAPGGSALLAALRGL
jgi:kumamolisin